MKHWTRQKPADAVSFSRSLKAKGLKVTPLRLAVHDVMMQKVHSGAEEVYQEILAAGKHKATRTGVYNVLAELSDKGIYARRSSPEGKMFYDVNAFRHIHLFDSRNREFVDVEVGGLLEDVEARLKGKRFRGYRMDDVDIQIICHPTRKKLI